MKYFKHIKQLLVVGILLVTTSSTLSASSIEIRIVHLFDQEEIDYYCVEYRELDTNRYPVGEWQCIQVCPLDIDADRGYSSCTLIGLNADTFYEFRVHAKTNNNNDNNRCWGLYGSSIIAYISISTPIVDIYHGRLNLHEYHDDEDGVYAWFAFLYREVPFPEEKWKQLCLA